MSLKKQLITTTTVSLLVKMIQKKDKFMAKVTITDITFNKINNLMV
jgi:hypothetical protein